MEFYHDFVLKERERAWLGRFISHSFGVNWYGWNWTSRFKTAYSWITDALVCSSASPPHQDLLSRAFPHDLNFLYYGNLCTIGVLHMTWIFYTMYNWSSYLTTSSPRANISKRIFQKAQAEVSKLLTLQGGKILNILLLDLNNKTGTTVNPDLGRQEK